MSQEEMKSTKKSKITTIIIIALVLILAAVVGHFAVQRAQGKTHPMLFGYGFGIVQSESMGSKLPNNSIIIIHKQDTYEIDDILTYEYDYEGKKVSVTNRLIGSIGNVYYLKGDTNNYEDPSVQKEQIVGKVVFHFPSWILIGLLVGLWLSFFATYGVEWVQSTFFRKKKPEQVTENQVDIKEIFNDKSESVVEPVKEEQTAEEPQEVVDTNQARIDSARQLLDSLSNKFKE
jgi:signal peptidase